MTPERLVIPAKAGIHCGDVALSKMGSGFRRNDGRCES
jgi:hypothetical protein